MQPIKNQEVYFWKEYFLYQVFINLILNILLGYCAYHPLLGEKSTEPVHKHLLFMVPMYGKLSVVSDTYLTMLILPGIISLFVTINIRKKIRKGLLLPALWKRTEHPVLKWFPESLTCRCLIWSLLGVVLIPPVLLLPFQWWNIQQLTYGEAILFKGGFAAAIAGIVGPVSAASAISDVKAFRFAAQANANEHAA